MKAKSKAPKCEPLRVKRGNVTVKVYTGSTITNGTTYPQFSLVYYDGNRRVRQRFGKLDEATLEAEVVATRLANGENEVLKLTSADRSVYLQALNLLRPVDRPLNLAVAEYVESVRLLPPGVSLKEAVSDFVHRHQSIRESRNVPALVDEYLASKEKAGRSDRHLGDLTGRLTKFGEAFQMPVAKITGKMLQTWLDSLTVGNRSKVNELRNATALLRFAVRRKYAPRELLDELEAVERPEVRPTETLVFTPDELREMFAATRQELVPWLAIAAFCGLRTAEILRLDWKQVNLERRSVEVKAENAKTAARRLVPLCESAVEWLTDYAKPEGRLAYYSEENKFYGAIVADVNRARKAGGIEAQFEWKRNGLRHSFCSYRLAVTHDAAKTALEAGNSPAMIFKHYRQLVTDDEAKQWFAVAPASNANIVPMPAAVA